MPFSFALYGTKKFAEVRGRRMAYFNEERGHGRVSARHPNFLLSEAQRMPHCEGLGRLVACDLIGMGDSDKLSGSGPDRYTYQEHRDFCLGCGNSWNSVTESPW